MSSARLTYLSGSMYSGVWWSELPTSSSPFGSRQMYCSPARSDSTGHFGGGDALVDQHQLGPLGLDVQVDADAGGERGCPGTVGEDDVVGVDLVDPSATVTPYTEPWLSVSSSVTFVPWRMVTPILRAVAAKAMPVMYASPRPPSGS